jgi:hypothetical protein
MCTYYFGFAGECNQYTIQPASGVVLWWLALDSALSPSSSWPKSKLYGGKDGGGGGARRRSTSALESGVGRGITPVASCHAETRRLDEACLMRGLQRSGSRPASKTKWCLDTRPDVAPGLGALHSASQLTMVSTAGACSGVQSLWMAE